MSEQTPRDGEGLLAVVHGWQRVRRDLATVTTATKTYNAPSGQKISPSPPPQLQLGLYFPLAFTDQFSENVFYTF